MEFISFRYEICAEDNDDNCDCIEDRYVLVSVLKNMQLIAELRFYPDGNHVTQNHYKFVRCSDDDLQEEIFDRANELAREHKIIN